jgi:competence protein ComFC
MPSFRWVNLTGDLPICGHCFSEMKANEELFKLDGFEVRCLYEYTEKIRSLLYQLKGCNDIELAPIFLANQGWILKILYHGYTIVPAPSFKEKDEERGFNHVVEMFKVLGLPFLFPLFKMDDVKQADLNYEERQKIGSHLIYDNKVSVMDKKILFVDDLVTTGATAKACCHLLKEHGAKKIQVLAMGHTAREGNDLNKTPP